MLQTGTDHHESKALRITTVEIRMRARRSQAVVHTNDVEDPCSHPPTCPVLSCPALSCPVGSARRAAVLVARGERRTPGPV